jgi:hypothetical protein
VTDELFQPFNLLTERRLGNPQALRRLTHLLHLATHSFGNLLIPHEAIPADAKS